MGRGVVAVVQNLVGTGLAYFGEVLLDILSQSFGSHDWLLAEASVFEEGYGALPFLLDLLQVPVVQDSGEN